MSKPKTLHKKIDYRYFVISGLIAAFLVIVSLWNPDMYSRLWIGLLRAWKSLVYFFANLFSAQGATPPLLENPIRDQTIIVPLTINELVYAIKVWSVAIFNQAVFLGWIQAVLLAIWNFLYFLVYVPYLIIPVLLFYKIIYFNADKNEDAGGDTKLLKQWKKSENRFVNPIKKWIRDFYIFNYEHRGGFVVLLIIALIGTNVFAMGLDIVSWYMVWTTDLSLSGTETIIISLLFDLIILIHNLGPVLITILAILVFDWLRKRDARKVLSAMQKSNETMRNTLGVATLILGPMGTGKTTAMSCMLIDTQKSIRELCLEVIQKYTMIFNDFPWKDLEKNINKKILDRKIVNRAQAKRFVTECYKWHLSKPDKGHLWGYAGPMEVDVGNGRLLLLEGLIAYAQAFILYTCPKPLAMANYSVNFDYDIEEGYFPLYDYDYINRSNYEIQKRIAKYSTIEKFDWLRMDKKVKKHDSHDWFVGDGHAEAITEISNERGNRNDTEGQEKDGDANQKNDGTNKTLRLIRHIASLDGHPLIYFLDDSQRLGAINQDLWEAHEDILRILFRDEMKIPMVFSWIDEAILNGIKDRCKKFHKKDRNTRKKNTLTAHLVTKLGHVATLLYLRLTNKYGYEEVSYTRETGRSGEIAGDVSRGIYYFIWKRTRAGMFATDTFSEFFDYQRYAAKFGFRDIPTYQDVRATIDELKGQESYLINKLLHYTKVNEENSKITYIKPENKKTMANK